MAKVKREFYEFPSGNTSAEIVNAARQSLRSTTTSRPFTPLKKTRTLYPNRPGSSESSIDSSELRATPRILSPIPMKQDEKKKESDNFDAYWKAKIAPVIGSLSMNLENLDIIKEVENLSDCLLRGGFLTGAVALPQQYKVKVFQCLIGHLENHDTKLLLKISRILLCLGVYDKNLVSISKLIFKLTRCEQNDTHFMEEKIVHCLLNILNRYDIVENDKAFVYCIGSIRVLSANIENGIAEVLVQYGLLQVLERHLGTCTTSGTLGSEAKANLLVQILGTFRNLADLASAEGLIEVEGLCGQLEAVILGHYANPEVLLVCYRLLSRISMFASATSVIGDRKELLSLFLRTLDNYTHNAPLLLRCCYVIGNVTANSNSAISHLHGNGNILESLSSLCDVYKSKICEKQSKEKLMTSKDVLCKAIRCTANMLQLKEPCSAMPPKLSKLLLYFGHMSVQNKQKELLLHILCCFNNMSYHSNNSLQPSLVPKHRKVILDLLLSAITVDDINITVEVISVLGNLTLHKDVVEILTSDKNLVQIFMTLLESKNSALVYKVCGMLTNITANSNTHVAFDNKLIKRCTELMYEMGILDMELSVVAAYLLWNVVSSGHISVTDEDKHSINSIMIHYLEDDYCEHPFWVTEFHPVAKRLLELFPGDGNFAPL